MSRHLRALKNAERDLAKRIAELDALRSRKEAQIHETENLEQPSEDNNHPETGQEDLDDSILTAETLVKKAKSKVAEAEMFVMRNRY